MSPKRGKIPELVREDEDGAYLGPRSALLERFRILEQNPCFEVFESKKGVRLILSTASRLPQDDKPEEGKYGIDFHRALPSLKEAQEYHEALPEALLDRRWTGTYAFPARDPQEYELKRGIYERFYSFIFGEEPKTIYVAPHCGKVHREPDEYIPFPQAEMDSWTGGLAALCAWKDEFKPHKRIMISIHSTGLLGAVVDIGDFGLLPLEDFLDIVRRAEMKFRRRFKSLAEEYKRDFAKRALRFLEWIAPEREDLDPSSLPPTSRERFDIQALVKGLGLYGIEVENYTREEIRKALFELEKSRDIRVITMNFHFSGRKTSELLKLHEKVEQGFLDVAIQFECSRFFLRRDPEGVAQLLYELRCELLP